MSIIEVPDMSFAGWRRWVARPRPSRDYDVRNDFGILGIYILATAVEKPGNSEAPVTTDLPKEILYIGKSTHIDGRLERYHGAVARYKKEYADVPCQKLWFSWWLSDWHNEISCPEVRAEMKATLAFYERALILVYARKFGCLPALNRE